MERELSNEHARLVYDIVSCVYERFRVDGLKRYVNDDRFRVDRDKNMRLLAFAFTIVFVWTGPKKFLEVSLCSRAKLRQRNVQEKCAACAKLLFLAN